MIKQLKLVNFGPHKNSVINFNTNFNKIKGDNGSGKTFIIEALKILTLNESFSQKDIKKGEKNCELELVHDNYTIKKVYNGKTVTTYITPNGCETEKLVGAKGYDDRIENLTKFRKMELSKATKSYNFIPVSEQISQYIFSPKDLMRVTLRQYSTVDFKLITQELETEIKSNNLKINAVKNNIAVLESIVLKLDGIEEVENVLIINKNNLNSEFNDIVQKIIKIKLNEYEELVKEKREELNSKLIALQIAKENINNAIKGINICPTCNRPLSVTATNPI
jgi:DNA repair exonuclease SbcCD ATPase subunit